MRWVIGLAGLLAIGSTSAPPRPIAPGKFVEWKAEDGPRTFRAGDVTVRVATSDRTGEGPPAITVSAPGVAPLRIANQDSMAHYASSIGIGPLTRGGPLAVIVQTYTGGAHCCMHVVAAVRVGKAFRAVDFGEWDGDGIAWPTDISGDGVADFRFVDNAFLYAFGSYAGSYPPPLVMNIRGLKAVDVSAEPAFRPLYAKDVVAARKGCLGESEPNGGACAAWAADAARLGQFAAVWPRVVKAIGTGGEWPNSCGQKPQPKPCYSDYPTALRAFLRKQGYTR
jgi:hypothetical protein